MLKFLNKNISLLSILSGNIMLKGSLFISWIIIARLIGSEGYGIIGLIKSTVLVSTLIFLFGLPNEIIRKFSIEQTKQNYNKNNELISGIFFGYFIIVLCALFSAFFFYNTFNQLFFQSSLTYLNFLLFLCFFLCYSLSIILTSVLNGLSKFTWQGVTNIILSFFCIPILFYTTKLFNINGALIGLIVIYFSQSVIYGIKLYQSNFKFVLKIKVLQDLKTLLSNSKYIFLHEVFYSISNLVFLILLMKTLAFSDLGIYNAGDQLTQMILFIPTSVLGYFLNQFILKNENDAIKFRRKFFTYSILFSLGLALITFLIKDLMVSLYGSQFNELKNLFLLFIISIIPQIINAIYQQNFIADSRTLTLFKITFFNSLFLIVGVLLLYYFDVSVLLYFIILRLINFISISISFKILS